MPSPGPSPDHPGSNVANCTQFVPILVNLVRASGRECSRRGSMTPMKRGSSSMNVGALTH